MSLYSLVLPFIPWHDGRTKSLVVVVNPPEVRGGSRRTVPLGRHQEPPNLMARGFKRFYLPGGPRQDDFDPPELRRQDRALLIGSVVHGDAASAVREDLS